MRRLVIRPGAIGDFILSLPALECLKAGTLEVWAASPNLPLVRFADRVRSIASTGLDLLGVTEPSSRLIEDLRGFDSIVSWYGANRPEFRDLAGDLKLPVTFFPALPGEDSSVHAADFYLAQVRSIVPCASDGIPRIRCEATCEDFAVIHPFSGSPKKNWPLSRFRELASELERSLPVRWCAGPEDPPLDGAVRIDDLYELACWLAKARLYVGNDSGITHLAAAAGTPVIALFGPTNPSVWGPRGANVRVGRWQAAGAVSPVRKNIPAAMMDFTHFFAHVSLYEVQYPDQVLAFYIAVLEPVLGYETLQSIEADAAFLEALSVAALMVRLLRDVGTPLLTNDWVRTQFARLLDQKKVAREGESLASILLEASEELGDWSMRISPDVVRGDGNTCLSGLLNLSPAVAIPRFCDRMDYLAGMFSNGRKYLNRLAQDVTVQVWSEGPSKLVLRFVEFHERIDAAGASTTQVHRAAS